jgi:hypothetical protein
MNTEVPQGLIDEWQLETVPVEAPTKEKTMPIYASAGEGKKKKYTPHPEGVYPAVCVDIHDIGWVHNDRWNKDEHKADFYFYCGEDIEIDGEKRPLLVRDRLTLSLGEKARLRKNLEDWRGQKFTDAELKKFDVEVLIGKPVMLSILHNVEGDDTYANVKTYMKLAKGMTAPSMPEGYVRMQDRDKQGGTSTPQDETEDPLPF